jgi:hypothetical protein
MAMICSSETESPNPEVFKPWGALMVLWGGGGVVCMREEFILNEIWAQDKIRILVGSLLV